MTVAPHSPSDPNSSPEWLRIDMTDVAEHGLDAALVLALIRFRSDPTGWQATRAQVAAQAQLTEHRAKVALLILRDAGVITSDRADRFRPTLTWHVCAGQPEKSSRTVTRMSLVPSPEKVADAVSSLEEVEEVLSGLELHPQTAPVEAVQPTTKPSRKRPATAIPADFRPTEAHWALARQLGVDLSVQGPLFVDHHTAKDSRFSSWDAALRTWIRKSAEWAKRDGQVTADGAIPPPRTSAWGDGPVAPYRPGLYG